MKQEICTSGAPAAVGAYSQGIKSDDLLLTSGQLPISPKTGDMPVSAAEQAAQSLSNVQAILMQEGYEMADVVKTTVLLHDITDFAAVDAVYKTFFCAPYPARSCFAVAALPKGAKVEIEVIAKK
jgi:2-iminobutanoate/2-iminopropanoate deaminase